ncbi:hypothetical protein CIPAW_12G055300 [Carya illinoinensis]|uniref:non-specific serine/threonine protein kinase n=1 Tax=Carya illinoinensis TaxID=32201 RepID=A0A8T1NV77_CARIL|nr:hypothetical protein CIPAW_12G055300 [Carya illinoinensis]
MWFLGFSTNNKRSFWVIGVIVLMIFLAMVLKRWLVYLESRANECSKRKLDGQNPHHGLNSSCLCIARGLCYPGHVIRTYALEELRTATREFNIRIGIGATSFVYLVELGNGRFGAVKRLMEERGGSEKIFLDEVSVLLRISHPNLVGLLGFCSEKAGEQLLLLEYVPNKSLFDKMHTYHGQLSGTLTCFPQSSFAVDIPCTFARIFLARHRRIALAVLKSKSSQSLSLILDLLISPVTLVPVLTSCQLVNNNHVKLADFGRCKLGYDTKLGSQTPTTVKGSFGYVDPHYLNTGLVSGKSDVYSFEVLLLELITNLKSTQGSVTHAGWTEDYRKINDIEVLTKMLDPKLNGNADLEQLRVLINIANLALLENSEGRPDMSYIVDRISSCMEYQLQPELPV